MGQMNAMGHFIVVAAGRNVDELWDFAIELNERLGTGAVLGVHGFTAADRLDAAVARRELPRYCVHPLGTPDIEVRHDDLTVALVRGCLDLAQRMPEAEMWRRD